ncbi:AraC family transcriptional regulator [Spongiimicrobium sp. 2-473A-2-J]
MNSTIAYDCGFNDANYFSKSFHGKFGVSPKMF